MAFLLPPPRRRSGGVRRGTHSGGRGVWNSRLPRQHGMNSEGLMEDLKKWAGSGGAGEAQDGWICGESENQGPWPMLSNGLF